MLSMQFHEYGPTTVLREDSVPIPVPGPDEVLIQVAACGVNRVDILSRQGHTPHKAALPHASGSEAAGTISDVGTNTHGWAVGARVVINPTLSCGICSACREGRDNVCISGEVFGVQTQGAYAEYVVVASRHIVALPGAVSFEAAASVAVTGATAYHMLVDRARVTMEDTVVIIAAGSGLGVMGIQIAKLAGARVIATAGSAAKRDAAQRLGADLVIDHSAPDWAQEVRRLTGGKGADVVFEHVGEATWNQSLRALAHGGRLVTCGAHSGSSVTLDLWHLFLKEQTLMGSFAGTRRDLEKVLDLVGRGQLAPVVHQKYPLRQAAQAQAALEAREVFGKVILTVE